MKRYLDEVFTAGHGSLYASDGRSRQDPSRQYGSGGLLQGRRYLLSLTWNAPREAFDSPGDFSRGGVSTGSISRSTRRSSSSGWPRCPPSSPTT
ncbi:NAD(P)H-dependent oxidoreductase [Salinicola tamaricis]|uniref:NAD(P)H-dependent oxidoreductase n=1 Tax=Salinicola tamaricis TaxID=1771309 RepID=UPI003BF48526